MTHRQPSAILRGVLTALVVMPFVGVVTAQGSGMGGRGGMGGFGWWPLLWTLLILVVVGLLVVAALDRGGASGTAQTDSDDALATLRTRYARGELSDEEFEERRARLENQS
ncbi:MAG: SHOCT domain-containing protein [Halolamina sp.]|uniref:SHOCT domain-containing protein n=1 Tax=Halolamina sp. TaxID=1940283 RepID=UPI002FC381D7